MDQMGTPKKVCPDLYKKKNLDQVCKKTFFNNTNPPHTPPLQKSNGSPLCRQHFVFVVLNKMRFQYASHCIGISQVV